MNVIKIVAGLGTSRVYNIFERKDDQVLKEKRNLGKVQKEQIKASLVGLIEGVNFVNLICISGPEEVPSSKIEKNGIYWRKCKEGRKEGK